MNKDTFLKCLVTGKNLMEANAAFFVKKVDKSRKEKGKKLQHYFKGVDRDSNGNAVIEFSIPSQHDTSKSYRCFIDIIPNGANLFTLSKSTKKLADKINILKTADVKCFCTCPDFNWSGMKYNMKHIHGSLSENHHADNEVDDHGEDINPKVRDPKHKNTLCKHLVAALSGVLTNAASIMKNVRETPLEEKPTPPKINTKDSMVGKKSSEDTSEQIIDTQADEVKGDAINSFDNSTAIKTEETQQALNALADNIEPGAEPSEDAKNDPGAGLIGHFDDQSNDVTNTSLIDYDKEAALPMFDVPLDEEEPDNGVDDESIIEEPLEIPH